MRNKINEETVDSDNIIGQLDLTDMYRGVDPITSNYTFFPSAHRISSRIDCSLGHEKNLKLYNLESYQVSFLITME